MDLGKKELILSEKEKDNLINSINTLTQMRYIGNIPVVSSQNVRTIYIIGKTVETFSIKLVFKDDTNFICDFDKKSILAAKEIMHTLSIVSNLIKEDNTINIKDSNFKIERAILW